MKSIAKSNLKKNMYPFWKNLIDEEFGGFYGYVDNNLNIKKDYIKGCILNSRILWFFSNALIIDKDEDSFKYANHAFEFLKNYCIDKENGGVFWSLKFDGKVHEDSKHTYNIAFAIYALSSYYIATKKDEALKFAYELFELIETKCKDVLGYKESFTAEFVLASNEKLADNEKVNSQNIISTKTMNTILHILEAYTEFYIATKDEKIKSVLKDILYLIEDKIIDKQNKKLFVFFDDDYNSLIDTHSYGHDIEAAWLIDRAVDTIGESELKEKFYLYTQEITDCVLINSYDNGRLYNERVLDEVDKTRVWWVQAETVIGLVNAFQKTNNQNYLDKSKKTLDYILKYFIDERENSEWFWELDENEKDTAKKPIVEEWKCPYHNGRMFFELIRRDV